jgi:hypothetical protein
MSTIIFTAGAKGGTGKSTILRFLITYLRENGLNPTLLDMDDESRTLRRYFPEAERVEMKKVSSNDILIRKVVTEGEKLIVADLKAGTGRDTLLWWKDVPFDDLSAEYNVRFICILSITSHPDSVHSAMNWASELEDKVSYVVCKNYKDGDIFSDYDHSHQAVVFRAERNPIHILLPELDAEYMAPLERKNLTVAEVLKAGGSQTINGKGLEPILTEYMVRCRLRGFQRNIYEQFEPVLAFLGD